MSDENTRPQPAQDFLKEARQIVETIHEYAVTKPEGRSVLASAISGDLRWAYRLGLAARPKVDDAEVVGACQSLRSAACDSMQRKEYDVKPGNHWLEKIADLLEHLAEERAELLDDVRAANDLAKDTIPMVERAEAAESKLAEREAELARDREEIAGLIVLGVAEIPDRNSPDDQPEMMFVTEMELQNIVMNILEKHAARQQQKASAEPIERNGE